MFVSVSMQLRDHANTQSAMRFKRLNGYAAYRWYSIKFLMLQVRENEISLRKRSGGATAHLHTSEGTVHVSLAHSQSRWNIGANNPHTVFKCNRPFCSKNLKRIYLDTGMKDTDRVKQISIDSKIYSPTTNVTRFVDNARHRAVEINQM